MAHPTLQEVLDFRLNALNLIAYWLYFWMRDITQAPISYLDAQSQVALVQREFWRKYNRNPEPDEWAKSLLEGSLWVRAGIECPSHLNALSSWHGRLSGNSQKNALQDFSETVGEMLSRLTFDIVWPVIEDVSTPAAVAVFVKGLAAEHAVRAPSWIARIKKFFCR